MPPAGRVKCHCGVHNLQQKVRFAASPQVVAVDSRGRNFASNGSINETVALSLSGGSIMARLRFGASRLGMSAKPGGCGAAPRSWRQLGHIQNNVMKQRLTEKAGSRLRVVCATHLQKRLPR